MAKKLTKAQIAKNPTKAINSGKMKMKKQEVPLSGLGKAAAKAVSKVIGKKTIAKGGSRQAGDYPVSGSSAKRTMPKIYANREKGKDFAISENVKIKNTVSPSGKVFVRGGVTQVVRENLRPSGALTKAEAKANARGLKAANKKTKASKRAAADKKAVKLTMRQKAGKAVVNATTGKYAARNYAETKMVQNRLRTLNALDKTPAGVSARFAATNARLAKEAAKKKSK